MNWVLWTHEGGLAPEPGLIVGVSAGVGGAHPLPERRTDGCENTRICYLTDHLIVRSVKDVLNGAKSANEAESLLREHVDLTLGTGAAQATIEVNRWCQKAQ